MNRHTRSLRDAPLKQNEQSWRRGKDGKAYEVRAKRQKEWQAFLGTKTTRPVPGNVGSLPPRERIERDPDFQRITTEQVGTPKRSRTTNGKGRCRGPQDFTSQRRYRKADRVNRPIEII